MTRRFWTNLELEFLRQVYANYTTEAIAVVLGRSIRQVYGKAAAMGLSKSEAYMASPAASRLRRGDRVGEAYQFKPGHVPANKGLRRPGYAPGRMAETQFKKGAMSGAAQHNYVPIGTLRINRDGYLEMKTNDDDPVPVRRWVAVHRLVWEATNGPIPPRHIIAFRPGMRTNVRDEITLDRLECITLADNMRRNTIHRYPKEIKEAVRSIAVLNRRINRVEKHQ